MSIEQRVDKIEEAISIMKDLVVSHNERLENYFRALQRSREDFDFKINALTDSQIRNETETLKSREDFDFKINALTDAQIRNETETLESREDFNFKLNSLIDLQMNNEMEIRQLKEASKAQLQRIERIENK